MTFSLELIALAKYMAGEFDNGEQAVADPAWYVHIRLWQRPVHLFAEDSITLFAEQANILKLDNPYRPRIVRLRQSDTDPALLQVNYYMLKDPNAVRGGGRNPALIEALTPEQMEFLPSCTLNVNQRRLDSNNYHFSTSPATAERCCFSYQDQTYYVALGFEATQEEFLTYDKGIDPQTGQAIWGALLGPFRYSKRQDFSAELAV
ncbi:chromophore lyase CpcT/CpeT [Microcoleus sp. FACHB-831]|uniref:chromophore lyase CpcT/CpeT n=1 Tax=Microcoleus sp. FACHB-831 TaxID=2692827 RepID=UPI001689E485|nr:chromophore lyase CpcT/CpeT [Microcoleus sp. FACHB-831]MBD1924582.1 chromophore lyase CpcT/CpeT [Microcoleus sp. FACHB-831]